MKIRSITCFCNPNDNDFGLSVNKLNGFVNTLREDINKEGWEVQTTRLATIPFGYFASGKEAINKIVELEQIAEEQGFTYLSIGPARLYHREEYRLIPEILSSTRNVFSSGMISHPRKGISMEAVRDCAWIITEAAKISLDGFTNLRFCAASNVKPFTPFFPASYSYGSQPAFSIAMESADAAVTAFKDAKDLAEGRKVLLAKLNNASDEIGKIAKWNARQFDINFEGFDFSLAPFPEEWCSIGRAMESLGIKQLGMMGSLTTAAILAETLDRGKWQHAGFNGLMLPVLEDSILALRSESGDFTVKDLLMYSAVCGTGLDTVPLPGEISAQQIEPLLMDLAALSLRLNKPLTARLMPVPGLASGQKTEFDFEFFKNGRVMDFPASELGGLIKQSDWIAIQNR